ncbi:MAG: hypothetical protein DRQ02_12510, partial [Candidatus Latescibacterota bacterium]
KPVNSLSFTFNVSIQSSVIERKLQAIHQKLNLIKNNYNSLVKLEMAWISYYWQEQGRKDFEKIKKTAGRIQKLYDKKEVEDIVILGIGGSDLGARALHKALNAGEYYNIRRSRDGPRIHFAGDNFAPDELSAILDSINIRKTLLIVISKSGTTAETFSAYSFFKEKLIKALGEDEYASRIIAITGFNDKSLLYNENEKLKQKGKEFFAILSVPEGIGGRYSVFSPVGMLYAKIAGLDLDKFLKGLRKAYHRYFGPLSEENYPYPYKLAKIMYLLNKFDKKNIVVFMPFDNLLEGLSRWYRQLHNESLGKTVNEHIYKDEKENTIARIFFSYNQDKTQYRAFKVYDSQGNDLGFIPLNLGESLTFKLEKEDINLTITREKKDSSVKDKITFTDNKNKPITYQEDIITHTQGTTALALVGTRDNHSSWQLINNGPKDKFVIFIRVEKQSPDYKLKASDIDYLKDKYLGEDMLVAAQIGTEKDATENNIPNVTFTIPYKDEETLSELMYTLMLTVAILGELYNINPFDQWAVEGYKGEMKRLLKDKRGSSSLKKKFRDIVSYGKESFIFNKGMPIYFYILKNFLKKAAGYIFSFIVRFERSKSHYLVIAPTSCSPTNLRRGISFSTSRHRRIASLMRLMSVGSVFAWVWHPRKEGHVAINIPSSSFSIITGNSSFFDIFGLLCKQIITFIKRSVKVSTIKDEERLNKLLNLIKGYKQTAPPQRISDNILTQSTFSSIFASSLPLIIQINKKKLTITQKDLQEITSLLPKILKEYDIRGKEYS